MFGMVAQFCGTAWFQNMLPTVLRHCVVWFGTMSVQNQSWYVALVTSWSHSALDSGSLAAIRQASWSAETGGGTVGSARAGAGTPRAAATSSAVTNGHR